MNYHWFVDTWTNYRGWYVLSKSTTSLLDSPAPNLSQQLVEHVEHWYICFPTCHPQSNQLQEEVVLAQCRRSFVLPRHFLLSVRSSKLARGKTNTGYKLSREPRIQAGRLELELTYVLEAVPLNLPAHSLPNMDHGNPFEAQHVPAATFRTHGPSILLHASTPSDFRSMVWRMLQKRTFSCHGTQPPSCKLLNGGSALLKPPSVHKRIVKPMQAGRSFSDHLLSFP